MVNRYFFAGLVCIVVVVLQGQFGILNFIEDTRGKNFLLGLLSGLGLVCELVGFLCNGKERKLTDKEVEVLSSTTDFVKMINHKIVMKTSTSVVYIEGENMEKVRGRLENALKKQ